MKLLDGRTVTDMRKASFATAELDSYSQDDVVVSIAVPPNTLVTHIFVITDDLGTAGVVDIDHTGYTDIDGDNVATAELSADFSISAAGVLRQDVALLVGTGTGNTGTTIQAIISTASTSSLAGDIRLGYIGVGIPSTA